MSESKSHRHLGPAVDYTFSSVTAAIVHRCEENPHAIALEYGSSQLLYSQLLRRAHDDAQQLKKSGVGGGSVVAISVPRSIELAVAALAVSLAGGAYCIMDPRWGGQWTRDVQKDVGAVAIVSYTGHAELRVTVVEEEMGRRKELQGCGINGVADSSRCMVSLDDPFAVYHTSGSTSRPKAIVVSHRGVLRTLLAPQYPERTSSLRMLCAAALPWDMLTLELWFPLLHGGTCVLADQLSAQTFRDLGLTTAWLTTSVFNVLVDEDLDCFGSLRELFVGGERLSPHHVRAFLRQHGGVRLVNGYGPAEANMLTTIHPIREEDCELGDGIPIGQPLPGTEVRLVERTAQGKLSLVGEGLEGEIAIAGDALFLGYIKGLSDMGANSFVEFSPDSRETRPFYLTGDWGYWNENNHLMFCGRRDHQLKINGQLINIFKVESTALKTGLVSQCAVAGKSQADGSVILAAYIVAPVGAASVDVGILGKEMAQSLPSYLVPATYVELPHLPLLACGKTDRTQLASSDNVPVKTYPEQQLSDRRRKLSSTEQGDIRRTILQAAADMLRCEALSDESDMFSHGLDSLGAFRLACRVSARSPKVKILASDIQAHRTAKKISNAIALRMRNNKVVQGAC